MAESIGPPSSPDVPLDATEAPSMVDTMIARMFSVSGAGKGRKRSNALSISGSFSGGKIVTVGDGAMAPQ